MIINQTHKNKFIASLKQYAIRGWQEYKILPSLTIAQAILESQWGTSNKIPNNLFGIKADSNWKGKRKFVQTHEYVKGQKIYIDTWFRVYDSLYESLQDRYLFLQKPRYAKVVNEKDYKTACKEIAKANYATDPFYATKLINLIEQNNLHLIDQDAFKLVIANSNTPSSWSKDAWMWTQKEGLLDGTRPKEPMTREEFATVLKRMW